MPLRSTSRIETGIRALALPELDRVSASVTGIRLGEGVATFGFPQELTAPECDRRLATSTLDVTATPASSRGPDRAGKMNFRWLLDRAALGYRATVINGRRVGARPRHDGQL